MPQVLLPGVERPVPAWRAEPGEKGPWPAVIVLSEAHGLNAYIKRVCEGLAAAGFLAVAPELFHRDAPGATAGYDAAGLATGLARAEALDRELFLREAGVAVQWLRGRPEVARGKVGVLGFGFGGALAVEVACAHPIDAVAACYPPRLGVPDADRPAPLDRVAHLRGPLWLGVGGDDPVIPVDAIAAAATALARAPRRATIEVFPGAGHGFTDPYRPRHDPAVAAEAWDLALRFLGRYLQERRPRSRGRRTSRPTSPARP